MTSTPAPGVALCVAVLSCFVSLSAQQGQQYFFTNPSAQQPRFVPSFQQPAPSQSQYDNFFSHLQSAYQQQQPQQSPFQLQGVFQQPYQSQPQPHQFSADVRPFGVQQRQPSFLDHITLSPTGFGSPARDPNHLRLLQTFPSEQQQSPSGTQFVPSFPDVRLNSFVDQHLEADVNPKANLRPTTIRPRDRDRKPDSGLRKKPGMRPQPGSRGNYIAPIRSTTSTQKYQLSPDYQEPQDLKKQLVNDVTTYSPFPRVRTNFHPHRNTQVPLEEMHPTVKTKSPNRNQQYNVRPNKLSFIPKQQLTSTTEAEPAEDYDNQQDYVYEEGYGVKGQADNGTVMKNVEQLKITAADSNNTNMEKISSQITRPDANNVILSDEINVNQSRKSNNANEDLTTIQPDNFHALAEDDYDYANEKQIEEHHDDYHMAQINPKTDENSTTVPDYDIPITVNHNNYNESILLEHKEEENHEHSQTQTVSVPEIIQESVTVTEEHFQESNTDVNNKSSTAFEVLTMNPMHTLVEQDNFKGFIDSSLIDSTELPHQPAVTSGDTTEESDTVPVSVHSSVTMRRTPDSTTIALEKENLPIREPIVSIVTTKSVINGTSVIVTVTPSTETTQEMEALPVSQVSAPNDTDSSTDSWIIIASVHTSRSVSGTKYLKPDDKQDLTNINETSNTEGIVETENVKDFATTDLTGSVSPENISSTTEHSQKSSTAQVSTESIIDKLDRVQSELFSGILTGGFRNDGNKIDLLTDIAPEKSIEMKQLNSVRTTPTTISTYKSPVVIRKFTPHTARTTPKSKKISELLENAQSDDLTGLLPPGFKPRAPGRRPTTTISPKSLNPLDMPQGDQPIKPLIPEIKPRNNTASRGRSSGISNLQNRIKIQDVSHLLPPGYKISDESNTTEKALTLDSILGKIKFQEVSSLLPPGYNITSETSTHRTLKPTEKSLPKPKTVDGIDHLLPPGYKNEMQWNQNTTVKHKNIESVINKAKPVDDISALLPPGYNLTPQDSEKEKNSSSLDSLVGKIKFQDVSSLLPPGFKPDSSDNMTEYTSSTQPSSGAKAKFPNLPVMIRKPAVRTTTTSRSIEPPKLVQPTIVKGWPARATTIFTGWPTSSTTPISIEKLLEQAKTATSSSSTTTTTTSTTTTTTTTTTTPRPTTPGVCSDNCDLAGTIKLIDGVQWVPELLDHNTQEWQDLANDLKKQLDYVYKSSDILKHWYTDVRIDGFSQGSVLVDYIVELNELGRQVNTQEIKKLFHESLTQKPIIVNNNSNEDHEAIYDAESAKLQLGNFIVDPKFTDFVVLPKQTVATAIYPDEDVLLPQWAIAGIVIGLASLLFVIIFGVTVLVNRHKNNKKKQPTPLTEDMLNELNKNHMGGLDNYGAEDLYNMEDVWNDKPYDKPPKKRSSASLQENSMSNLYDSWRSEWNGYYYNAYYGNGSSTSGYARRRSDYDTNF